MIGVLPGRPGARPSKWRCSAGATCAVILAFSSPLAAQTTPADPPGVPVSPDNPASGGTEANPALPPYAPSNNAASPLLPTSPPLPPHPSIPDASLLPDSTPRPAVPLPPLPVPTQTGSALSPATSGAPLTNGAAGTTPTTNLPDGATFTNNTAAVRRFGYAFRLSTGFTYDDNLFLTSNTSTPVTGNSQRNAPRRNVSRDDVYFLVEPSVSLGYGDFLSRATNYVEFDYTADALIYTKNPDQDTVQHFLNLQGAYHASQVTFTLSQGVQILDNTDIGSGNSSGLLGGGVAGNSPSAPSTQVNLDASQRTRLDIFLTHAGANYAVSDKTSVDLDGYFSAYDYQTLISSDTLSGDVYFNYSPTGKITLGLGVTGGYVLQSDPAPNEFYEQINLRLNYVPTSKLTFTGSVGIEVRETDGVGGTVTTPIFNLSVDYAPYNGAALTLAASRQVDTSAVLSGQNFDSTGLTFTISQRFLQRGTARLSMGYTHSSYVSSGAGVSANRTDDYYYVQPGLDYSIRDNLSASLFYLHRQSRSSLAGNGFDDNQIGARLSLSF